MAVHPRAGGEHRHGISPAAGRHGSSPRWRGTRCAGHRDRADRRFIPALAGNTPPTTAIRAVSAGSSPRWRGTPARRTDDPHRHRFIPALAGNTALVAAFAAAAAVHPRAGGEHINGHTKPLPQSGSSPRWRGTPTEWRQMTPAERFIPALAGNTSPSRSVAAPCSVHPRAGGEHGSGIVRVPHQSGSSPRWRGTPPRPAAHPMRRRFIPALAGTPGGFPQRHASHRFIPALAGNTARPSPPCAGPTVHPRAGGEHLQRAQAGIARGGSSPRWRGTHGPPTDP